MTSGADAFARRRAESGGSYGPSSYQAPGKVNTSGKGAWGGYHSYGGGYNHGTQPQPQQQSSNTASSMPLATALKGVEEAVSVTDNACRCAAAAIDNSQASKAEVEGILSKLVKLIPQPVAQQVTTTLAGSPLPGALVRTIKRFHDEASCASLACVVAVRSAGSVEGASAQIRAGALDEVNYLMESHAQHGGVQNVCLLLLAALLKDTAVARQAVASGSVNRVLSAMELTTGREVQYNGLSALRLLLDSGRSNRAFLQDNPKAPRANLQEAALRAKVAHQSDNAVCNAANDVLALVTPRFKEVLCWHWQSGWCKLGPRCTYAHGQSDLRGHGVGAGDGRIASGEGRPGGKGVPGQLSDGPATSFGVGKQGGSKGEGKGAAEGGKDGGEGYKGVKGSGKGYGKRGADGWPVSEK
eukprot:gb/GFBE01007626.1/.p1 GENE.gb/GFBE01007626.1/~~gb/GFBE01007626.1/.p1  ORF type:complete len:413 (+),score=94.30 gb/GFBE01007626.1/:1-1239(+)